jgi:hypothetical protein
MTYLESQEEGNRSMSEKRRTPEDVEGGAPRDPRDIGKSWIA